MSERHRTPSVHQRRGSGIATSPFRYETVSFCICGDHTDRNYETQPSRIEILTKRRELAAARAAQRSEEASTTSKSRPVMPRSEASWSLSQPRWGAPEMNQSEPLSATISP